MGKKKKLKKIQEKVLKVIEITQESSVRCPWCSIETEAKQWNDLTLSYCTSREMKRAFRTIYDKQVWGRDSDHFYICPACKTWSRGNQLILLDEEGNQVKNIGGQPVIS